MSMYVNFEPHSWYKGWAIKDNWTTGHDQSNLERPLKKGEGHRWSAYTGDGNTYRVLELHAITLKELKQQITIRDEMRHFGFEEKWELQNLVFEYDYNPNHPDDTFNAGVWEVFYSLPYEVQMSMINKVKEKK